MALTEASPIRRIVKEAYGRCRITLAETVKQGDALGYSSGWKRSLATVGTVIPCELIALEAGISGDVIEAAAGGVLGGFTGGTPGSALYQAEGSAYGEYTETKPTTGSDIDTVIGRILSASEVLVLPSVRAADTV